MRTSRWFVLAVLFIARFVLGYQFQSAGSVAPFLIRDFNVNYAQIGMLVGLFMLPGLVVSVPTGFLGRHFGDKNVVLSGLLLMAVGGVLSGVAQTYWMVLTGRALSGVGGVFLFVLMTKMLTDWFADKELYLGMAIFIIGWPVGIAAAQATQGPLAELKSWNAVFISSGVLVLNLMMVAGLAVSVAVGILIPFVPGPLLAFALFGIAFAAATPVIASLPAEVLEPRNRGPGFGVYWLWYFGGLPVLTALGGLLKDLTGTATTSVIFAAAMMLTCLLLLGIFRFLQSRWMIGVNRSYRAADPARPRRRGDRMM